MADTKFELSPHKIEGVSFYLPSGWTIESTKQFHEEFAKKTSSGVLILKAESGKNRTLIRCIIFSDLKKELEKDIDWCIQRVEHSIKQRQIYGDGNGEFRR